jgi:hypothetical protein
MYVTGHLVLNYNLYFSVAIYTIAGEVTMDQSFFAHLEQLELMGFFAGYPLVYAIIFLIAGKRRSRPAFTERLVSLLPYGYALTGTLYWGLLLKNNYPDYSWDLLISSQQEPYLRIWGLLAILFWIPVLARKPVFSLLHSLVFFFLLLKDLIIQMTSTSFDRHIIRNDMKVYTDSVLLNIGALAILVILTSLYNYFLRARSSRN